MPGPNPWDAFPSAGAYASGQPQVAGVEPPIPAKQKSLWDEFPSATEYATDTAVDAAANAAVDTTAPHAGTFWETLGSQFSGRWRREENIAELPATLWRDGQPTEISWIMTLARGNPKAAANLAQRYLPGTSVRNDEWGNPIIKIPANYQMMDWQMVEATPGMPGSAVRKPVPKAIGTEKEFYLNRPGFSGQDMVDFAPDAAIIGGAAATGGALGAGAGLVGRALGAAAGGFAGSVGMDAAGAGAGTGEPIDWKRAAVTGGLSAGGEVILPVGGAIWRAIRGNAEYFDAATGQLTAKGMDAVRAQGIDPATVNKQFAEHFAEQASKGADPAQAVIYADAKTLPTPVDLTKGDISRDVTQQGFEDAAAKGAYGQRAQSIMQGQRALQQDQLRQNTDQIAEQLGGGQRLAPGEGATNAMETVKAAARQDKRAVDSAYEAARTIGQSGLNAAHVGATADEMATVVLSGFDLDAMPKVQGLINKLYSLSNTKGGPDIKALENWRTQVVNAGKGDMGQEGVALTAIKKRYDEMLDEALDHDLMTGDPATIAQWQQARELRADFGKRFESNKIIAKMVKNKVEPDQAVNYLFGAGRLGFAKQSTEAAVKMKEILGEASPGWQGLKQEAFLRLLRGADGAYDQGMKAAFNGTAFAQNMDEAMTRAPTLMRTLFTPEEIGLIQQFKRVGLQATNKVPGAVNTSNSAIALSRIAQDLFGSGSVVMRTLYSRFAMPLIGEGRAISAASGYPQRIQRVSPGVAGAGAATVYSQRETQ